MQSFTLQNSVILANKNSKTIRKCRNKATACRITEPHPLNSANWSLLRICKSSWGHTIPQHEKSREQGNHRTFLWLHLGLWQAAFPLNYLLLKILRAFERLQISCRVKAATCFVLTAGTASGIYNLPKQKNVCSFMRAQTTLFFRSGLNTNKKGDILEGSKGFCDLLQLQKSMNAQASRKLVKDLPWKDATGGGSLFVKPGLFIFNLTLSFC